MPKKVKRRVSDEETADLVRKLKELAPINLATTKVSPVGRAAQVERAMEMIAEGEDPVVAAMRAWAGYDVPVVMADASGQDTLRSGLTGVASWVEDGEQQEAPHDREEDGPDRPE